MRINPLRATLIAILMVIGVAIASEGVDDILRLQRAGVSEEVQLAFVANQNISYDPTAIELEILERDGVSASVMVAMIDRGRAFRAGELSTTPVSTADAIAESSTGPTTVQAQPVGDAVATSVTVTYAPPAEEMNISFMYEAMSPHGKWYEDSDYGWVWQPSVVVTNVEWRPYVDSGHWEWTDHGWFWVSHYEWGWAPFHYGRWYRHHHHHWVWVPDTTWGPAWVSWRQSDDYYGWAPLPPRSSFSAGVGFSFRNENVGFNFHFGLGERDFAFVPAAHFCDRDFHRHTIRGERGRNIYNRTTIVNNTYVYNDNRIINNGIPRERVERSINRRLETVRIREERAEAGRPIPRNRQSGNELAVFKPQVRETAPVTPPVAAQRRQERIKQRQVNQAERTDARVQSQQARQLANDKSQERREQAQAAARERLEQEKKDRQTNREKSVQERDAASAKRAQEAQSRQSDRKQSAVERDQNAAQRQQSAVDREAAIRLRAEQEKAQREAGKIERQQQATQRETEARQRLEQEKAQREVIKTERQQEAQQREKQRDQNAAQRQREAQQREQAQRAEREKSQSERQQQATQREAEARQRLEQEKAQRQAEQQARQDERQQAEQARQRQVQQRQQDRQERVQERQQERRESPAPRSRDRD